MIKRLFDISISLLLFLVFLWWFMPLVAACIYVATGQPVIFRQYRIGKNGKRFTCYKFRTMVLNEQSDLKQATSNDPRITKVGKYFRETNLDELPQFWNVLIGDMSIVGPRPHMISDSQYFESLIPDYAQRYAVKPGITGMAQIKGYRGPTPDFRSIYKRWQWDLYYVRHHHLFLDLFIIIQTAVHIIRQVSNWKKQHESAEPAYYPGTEVL